MQSFIKILIDKLDGRGSLGRQRIFGRILKMELMKIFEHLFMVYLMREYLTQHGVGFDGDQYMRNWKWCEGCRGLSEGTVPAFAWSD
jgi:hypothetical protein